MQQKPEISNGMCVLTSQFSSSEARSSRRETWAKATDAAMERLDGTTAELLAVDVYQDARIILFGFSNKDLHYVKRGLQLIGYEAIASCADLKQLANLCNASMGFTHVLVNIDAFDGVEKAVEVLLSCRSEAPEMVILAFSEMVSGDDFGTERREICDVTLKLPVSVARLKSGMAAALLNHEAAYEMRL
jgi:hypothetical protein